MSRLIPPEFAWIVDGLIVSLVLGLTLAFVASVMLLVRPGALFAINARVSRWVDTAAHFRELERPRNWERFFYRHHRALGTFITLGAAYVLWAWGFTYNRGAVMALISPRLVANGMDWLVAALETLLVLLHGAILVVGVVIFVRPSLLKNIERAANRWHDGPAVAALDRVVTPLDRGFLVYPRLSGLVLLLTSSWCLAVLLPVAQRIVTS